MSKISDFLARKISLAVVPSDQEEAPPSASALDGETNAAGGTRLGAENEALRSLVADAARRIEDLDDLKMAFGRIIDPLQRTLQVLEQEKARNVSLYSSLNESRALTEGLWEDLQQSK